MQDIEKLQPETMESQKHKSAIILNLMIHLTNTELLSPRTSWERKTKILLL